MARRIQNATRIATSIKKKFYIKNKKELLLTFASDFGDQLSLGLICEFFDKWTTTNGSTYWKIVAAKEKGDKDIPHEHFHLYLCVRDWSKSFSTVKVNCFDIQLRNPVIAIYKELNPNFEIEPKLEFELVLELVLVLELKHESVFELEFKF